MDTILAVVYGKCSGKQHLLLLRERLVSSSAACVWFVGRCLVQVDWNPFYFVKIAGINAVGCGKRWWCDQNGVFFWSLCCGVTAKLNECLNTFENISSVLGCVVLCYCLFTGKVCLVQSMHICYCFWSWHTPCSLLSTCSTLLVLKIPALLA